MGRSSRTSPQDSFHIDFGGGDLGPDLGNEIHQGLRIYTQEETQYREGPNGEQDVEAQWVGLHLPSFAPEYVQPCTEGIQNAKECSREGHEDIGQPTGIDQGLENEEFADETVKGRKAGQGHCPDQEG